MKTPNGTRTTCWAWWALFLGLTVLLLLLPAKVDAQLYYTVKGQPMHVTAVQSWHNGYWKHPGWINGSLAYHDSCTACAGKILVHTDPMPPYDHRIRESIAKGAIAVVMHRDRIGTPGQGMYYVTGHSQADLNVPVVEIYQRKGDGKTWLRAALPSDGSSVPVQIWPMPNTWKEANDKTVFQIVWNVLLCSIEIAIICLGLLRLNDWLSNPGITILSIGPLCITLELIGAIVRLALTIVDPYFSLRLLPAIPAMILTSASFPFVFASGILLTFFWAESLSAHRVQATPFIADYKKSAIGVIILLFVGEFSTSIVRSLVPVRGSFSPLYLAQAFYIITAIGLIVCYLICAYKITQKLKSFNRGRKTFVRRMTLRFALSTSGYVLFILVGICSIPLLTKPWPYKVLVNLLAFSANLAGILQVYGLAPPNSDHPTTSSSTGHNKGTTNSDVVGSRSPRVGKDSVSSHDEEAAQSKPFADDVDPESEEGEDSPSSSSSSYATEEHAANDDGAVTSSKLPQDNGETAEQKTHTTDDATSSNSSSSSAAELLPHSEAQSS